ncbi:MAG: glycine--tRNA ligase subunit beta [Pseudomonadales bacterium]
MSQQDFLVELGTAELPPTSLKKLSDAFTREVVAGIKSELGKESAALFDAAKVESFASPRRLAIRISSLITEIPGSDSVVQGPPVRICYNDQGEPTNALLGFAKKSGVTLDQLSELDGKVSFTQTIPAKPLINLLPQIVEQALSKLPIAKRMRWGASKTEFVRPVQWLLMMFGQEVVECEILGAKASNTTRGHRFHCNKDLQLSQPSKYESTLQSAYVMADYQARKTLIEQQVKAEAEKIQGVAQIDDDLLDEVTGLNEWPVALLGSFDKEFLAVPQEALILSMKEHQKYFYVTDTAGVLLPNFITVSNIESKDPNVVIAGNEKVIRPRLADAMFFLETDKKTPLIERCEKLKQVVFQKDLGTVYQKSERIANLSSHIANLIGGDSAKAQRASSLAKADLVTDMVFEFTDLQGLMGYHYALHDGEDPEVAQALNEQYLPKFAGDELPQTKTGIAVALADRLDTLSGMFGIGQPPTGSKDPFALRRATLGVMRILIEHKLDLDLKELIELAVAQHSVVTDEKRGAVNAAILSFMLERLRAYYEDRGIRIDTYLSVAELSPTKPLDFDNRVNAVEHFRSLPQAQALAAANKRVSNILSKEEIECASVDNSLLTETAEIALANALNDVTKQLAPVFDSGDYRSALSQLAELQQQIDSFFDDVMVMADDPAIKANRLALLQQLRAQFLKVADISLLN